MNPYSFEPIGFMKTAFTEKFGIPRQSMMVTAAQGILKLNPNPDFHLALKHLEKFSHIWIVYVFHQHMEKGWRPTIRPPRIDAPRKVGVFASRSPHRPNPIGMSAVILDRIDLEARGGIEIHLSGVDIMNGTPVLDIKPYLPFADSLPEANGGWAQAEITKYNVSFSLECLRLISLLTEYPGFKMLVTQMLEWDPRPTSQRRAMPIDAEENEGMIFAFRILNQDVKWQIRAKEIFVIELISVEKP